MLKQEFKDFVSPQHTSVFTSSGMRGESYFIGMRSLGQQASIPEDGGLFFLCCIDRDWAVTQCFAEEAFQAITDFNDLPNSLFACNVHQSVFEEDESKVRHAFRSTERPDISLLSPLGLVFGKLLDAFTWLCFGHWSSGPEKPAWYKVVTEVELYLTRLGVRLCGMDSSPCWFVGSANRSPIRNLDHKRQALS